jgi:hypothetical protein
LPVEARFQVGGQAAVWSAVEEAGMAGGRLAAEAFK